MVSFSSRIPPCDSALACRSGLQTLKALKRPVHIRLVLECQGIPFERSWIHQVYRIHNLHLDPNRPRLYDFLTEIGPSSRCRGEAALWRLRMARFFLQPGSGRDADPYTVFFGSPRPLFVAVNKLENPQPLIRQWFPVNSQALLQDIHIRLT